MSLYTNVFFIDKTFIYQRCNSRNYTVEGTFTRIAIAIIDIWIKYNITSACVKRIIDGTTSVGWRTMSVDSVGTLFVEVYDQWIFSQNQYFVDKVYLALGTDRVNRLSEKQLNLLNNALYRLKASKSVFDITLEEIVGQYELVTEHISPRSLEIAVENYQKRQKMN